MRLLLPLLLAACGPAEPENLDGGLADAGLSGSFRIGTGTGQPGYLPLTDGQELVLEPGAQGGFHVYLNLRLDQDAANSVGTTPIVAGEARRTVDNRLVSRLTDRRVELEPQGVEFDTASNVLLFMCPAPAGVPVADQELQIELRVSTDRGGPAIKGMLRFTPRCPQGAQAEFCRNICFG